MRTRPTLRTGSSFAAFVFGACLPVAGGCGQSAADCHPPGVMAPDPPKQWAPPQPSPTFTIGTYQLTALAGYDVTGMVLGAARYRWDAGADLSPVDLAMGWGPMSDTGKLRHISFSQSGRWLNYSWSGGVPITAREVSRNCSNVHVIPAEQSVRDFVLGIRTGDVVRLQGWLVDVRGADGGRWRSSLYRSDSGGGACEVMLVTRVDRITGPTL